MIILLIGQFNLVLLLSQDSITAITLVALGTSLPDTFASKTATIDDDNADAAVGNVTGSNSVNVRALSSPVTSCLRLLNSVGLCVSC